MSKSKIEWCDRTWNPVTGCTPISEGCAHCYAKRMAERFAVPWGLDPANPFKVQLRPQRVDEPLRWKKPSNIFVCSMSDLFHEDVPDSFLDKVFTTIAKAHHHTYLILTKRPERMKQYIRTTTEFPDRGWPQVWLGVTTENQEQADKRIPTLLSIPAAKRFVSVEPMLGPVELLPYLLTIGMMEPPSEERGLDWVICGGESGPGARPMHLDWARSLRDQCAAAGTPFLFKQWGEWSSEKPSPFMDSTKFGAFRKNEFWESEDFQFAFGGHPIMKGQELVYRVGKKAAGRLLDGVLHNERPVLE